MDTNHFLNLPVTLPMPEAWRDELSEWLTPVGKGSKADIDAMARWFEVNQGQSQQINVYYCAAGHDTVTIDRALHGHQKTVPCPYCKAEARSLYYLVDQQLNPSCEFYRPRDILAFPKYQQEALRRGGLAFKPILFNEPIRRSVIIRRKLSKK